MFLNLHRLDRVLTPLNRNPLSRLDRLADIEAESLDKLREAESVDKITLARALLHGGEDEIGPPIVTRARRWTVGVDVRA